MKKVCFGNKFSVFLAIGFVIVFLAANAAHATALKIDNQELQKLIEQGIPVIDVRTPEEWRTTGIIPNSHLLTFFDNKGNYNLNAWLRKLFEIAKPDQPVVIICEVGNRSHVISNFLSAGVGFRQVFDASDGMSTWIEQSLPVLKWPQ